MDENNTWKVNYGIHNGTLDSRDVHTQGGYASQEECENAVRELETSYAELGYVIWFAHAVDPGGNRFQLREEDISYKWR